MQAADRELWKLERAAIELPEAVTWNLSCAQYQATQPERLQSPDRGLARSQLTQTRQTEEAGGNEPGREGSLGDDEGPAGPEGNDVSGEVLASKADAGKRGKVVVGYWKQHSTLAHVIIRNAGHMVSTKVSLASGCQGVRILTAHML
jgi:hypothetical protein